MKPRGIYVSPTQFVSFAEGSLSAQIATRDRRPDFNALGMLLPNPDPVLRAMGKSIQVYRDLRAAPAVGGNIRRRKGAVKALERGMDRGKAKSRAHALVSSVFENLDLSRIISEILDASLYGYQPLEIIWGKVGGYIVPVDLQGKPPEWFHLDQANQLRLLTRDNMVEGELLPPRKFLLPRQDATYDNPYGVADLSMCFWPVTFMKGGLTFWVQFGEKYGTPWLVGRHPRNTPPHETDLFLDQLSEMIQDAVAVIPDDSSVEIVEASGKGASADVFERLLMFCRSEINIALLGQNQSSEADSTRASAQAGLEVTQTIRDDDKALVESALNQLIRWIHELNFGDGSPPKFEMWEQREVDEVQAKRDKLLYDSGARFTPSYFSRAYGLQDGDLAAQATPSDGPAFAEQPDFPDQAALDTALESLALGQQAQAEQLLAPLLALVSEATDYDDLNSRLAAIYPTMDASDIQDTLSRALFAAKLWGYANGDD